MSNFQPLGNGVYRVSGMKRDAVTNRFITTGEEVSPEDTIPLVTSVRTVDTAWNLYIGGAIQVREKNNGEVQFRMGGDTEWTTAGFKEVR